MPERNPMSFNLLHPLRWVAVVICLGACVLDAGEVPVSFSNDVMPVLTKAGCNTGGCHAKAGGGRNGFQLSLFGFEPLEDFEHLTKEDRGRRLSPAVPEQSLILKKASGQLPHGGGLRLPVTGEGYAILRAWIGQGAPADKPGTPELVSFAIQPERGTIARQAEQQLTAIAKYSDVTTRDVTPLAIF